MKRLTVDKEVLEMGMYELAHNCCYIDADNCARYRDFDTDIDVRDMARNLMVQYGVWKNEEDHGTEADNELISDDIFDESMIEYLMFGAMEIEGLIALFYRNLWAMADLRARLKEYEDAEEQGLLLRLPCEIGDDVYYIPSKTNYKLNILNGHKEFNKVHHQKVSYISYTKHGWHIECDKDIEYGTGGVFLAKMFKETWFLSQEEAEKALADMGE